MPEGIEVPEDLLENVVMVRRLGEVVVPVEVLVQFADGREVIERWDGRDRSVTWTLTGPAKVVGITVDPNQKLALDIDRSNNSWRREADHRGSWKLTLRWMFWLQSLLEFFAFIS